VTAPELPSTARRYFAPTGSSTAFITSRPWIHNTSYYRDGPQVWEEMVADRVLYAAARSAVERARVEGGVPTMRVWSCGCSSGEELFTARMVFHQWVAPVFGAASPEWHGEGTDRDRSILDTARSPGCEWSEASLAALPDELKRAWFVEAEEDVGDDAPSLPPAASAASSYGDRPRRFSLPLSSRTGCEFRRGDPTESGQTPEPCLSRALEDGGGCARESGFDIIMCRYSIFLYSSETLAAVALVNIVRRLAPGGVLLLGVTDNLPRATAASLGLQPFSCADGKLVNAWHLPSTQDSLPQPAAQRPAGELARGMGPLQEDAMERGSMGLAQPGTTGEPLSLASALAQASSLREFRRLLGWPSRFTEHLAPPPMWTMSDRSSEILKAKGGLYDEPLVERAAHLERRRVEGIARQRQERLDAEEEEVRRAIEARQEALRKKKAFLPEGSQRSFLARLQEEARAREERRLQEEAKVERRLQKRRRLRRAARSGYARYESLRP